MQLFPKDVPPEDERKQKLRALRSAMAERKGPAKTIEDVEMSLRSSLVDPLEERNVEAEGFEPASDEFDEDPMIFAVDQETDEISEQFDEEAADLDEISDFDDQFPEELDEMRAEAAQLDDPDGSEEEFAPPVPEMMATEDEFGDDMDEIGEYAEEPDADIVAQDESEDPIDAVSETIPDVSHEDTPEADEPEITTAFNAASLISQLRARAAHEKPQAAPQETAPDETAQSAASRNVSALLGSLIKKDETPSQEASPDPEEFVEEQVAAPEAADDQEQAETPEPMAEPDPDAADEPPMDFGGLDMSQQVQQGEEPPLEDAQDIDFADVSKEPQQVTAPDIDGPISVPVFDEPAMEPAAAPAAAPRRGRAKKTRLLGFNADADGPDLFAQEAKASVAAAVKFPVGWVVVIEGPGCGECFTLSGGAAQIGRGDDQAIRLDFGDTSISRENHAAIAYDQDDNKFLLAQGGKANLVRLNRRPVLSNETLTHGDEIKIGETTLKFIALCGGEFAWKPEDKGAAS